MTVLGFRTFRADKEMNLSIKKKYGGVALVGSEKLCYSGHVAARKSFCGLNIGAFIVRMCPYYFPREVVIGVAVIIQFGSKHSLDSSMSGHRENLLDMQLNTFSSADTKTDTGHLYHLI